jgi:hypothetical protein
MKKILVLCVAALAVGCAPTPSIDTSSEAELSFDGLAPIKGGRFAQAWIDPDVDLRSYTKVIPGGAEFEFRAVKKTNQTRTTRRSNDTEFWISEENKQKLIDTVNEIFNEEMQKSKNFTVTDTPAPDALILVGAMHDIVSRMPPEMVGRGEVFLSSVGEATLILELRDSLSGETIYRAVDRRAMDSMGDVGGIQANSVTAWSEVRRLARRWATRLVEGLDSIHDQ